MVEVQGCFSRAAHTDWISMTQKTRLNNTLHFGTVDRPPFMEIALWEQTVERWKKDGLPGQWGRTLEGQRASVKPSMFLDRYFASFGFYSMLRNWMGTEGLSYMFFDDHALVLECLGFLTGWITGWLAGPLTLKAAIEHC